jgi:hypothetical protein
MGYYIDLKKITLLDYKQMLKARYLIPSMRALLPNIDKNFEILAKHDIENMDDLKSKLKAKKNVEAFSLASNIDFDYLNTLRREVNSHHSPPRKIANYPTVDVAIEQGLTAVGIKTSVALYTAVSTPADRRDLALKLNCDDKTILHLTKLSDVTRLRYVSGIYASLLVLSGFDSIEKISKADAQTLCDAIANTNEKHQLFKGKLGVNDARFLIQDTQHVSQDIVY